MKACTPKKPSCDRERSIRMSHRGNSPRPRQTAAFFLLLSMLAAPACQHAAPMDFDRLDEMIPEPRMESVSHTLLRPRTDLVYLPESQVRRGLAARDIVLDGEDP